MSKFVYFIILGGLALAAIAVVNVGVIGAGEGTRSVQFSVLAEDQANYGVDENFGTIPAVSADIIEDKVHDSSVPIFTYTPLNKDEPEAGTRSEDEDEAEVYNDRGEEVVDKEEEKEEKEDTKEEEKEDKEDIKEEEKEDKQDTKESTKDTKQDLSAKEDTSTKETKVKDK